MQVVWFKHPLFVILCIVGIEKCIVRCNVLLLPKKLFLFSTSERKTNLWKIFSRSENRNDEKRKTKMFIDIRLNAHSARKNAL